MDRTIDNIIASLPTEQQRQIESRYQELREEVESLQELRQIAGKAQADVASALNIKQPSVSKIEKQADMYLSTLRGYVEAIGGTLELTVKLPMRRTLTLASLGDVGLDTSSSTRRPVRKRKQVDRH